jgi:hypothetical protein
VPLALTSPPSPGGFIVWCGIGFIAGIYLFFRGFYLLQRRRLILDTPFSKIRSAAMGMVEVSGLAVGPYTMLAPITGRPCYYYRTQAWEYKQNGKNKQWVSVAGECMHVPFFLDDNTGRVLVDPRGAELDLHRDFKEDYNTSFFSRDDTPANVNSFLARHGVATTNRIKIEECCIKPKNALFILGTLGENPGVEVKPEPASDADALNHERIPGFSLSSSFSLDALSFSVRNSLDSGPNFSGSDSSRPFDRDLNAFAARTLASQPTAAKPSQQKVADALVRAGITNPAAWTAAGLGGTAVKMSPEASLASRPASSGNSSSGRSSSFANPANTANSGAGFDPNPPVALMKGQNNKAFLISWRSQQEVARSLGWKCTLMIWGGPALALLSLYGLINLTKLFGQ